MADAALEFLLTNLTKVIEYNAKLILNVNDDVKKLKKELSLLNAKLQDHAEEHKHSASNTLKALVQVIRDVVYRAEDAVETYVATVAMHNTQKKYKKIFRILNHGVDLKSKAEKIRSVITEVEKMYDQGKVNLNIQPVQWTEEPGIDNTVFDVDEKNADCFEDVKKKIIEHLSGGKEDLEVFSIIGMPGGGKTALAKRIFNEMKDDFARSALVSVSQNPGKQTSVVKQQVWLNILDQVQQQNVETKMTHNQSLDKKISNILENEKYLILIDDVWENEVWDGLKIAFPNNKKHSRILLTTRVSYVAKYAVRNADPHHLRLLDGNESWKLLQQKALVSLDCPHHLETIGQSIATKCEGLPLAIDIIGGILQKRGSEGDSWKTVEDDVSICILKDEKQRLFKSVALSFDHLPYQLRLCFVYFGMFPKNKKIRASTLIRLWIAEGLIPQVGKLTMEASAEEYLEQLVSMNLVMVKKRKFNGQIKKCLVHGKLHEFCKKKAEEEFFFEELNELSTIKKTCRRIGTNFDRISDSLSPNELSKDVRTFLCDSGLEPQLVSSIPKAFKLLRVLYAPKIPFPKFPDKLTTLIHLTYLDISIDSSTLPAEISNLLNIQTFIVKTSSRTLKVQANIWKMRQLRHFLTNVSTNLPDPPIAKKGDPTWKNINLQTLSSISPESCTTHVFDAAPNLKKLLIRGDLSKLLGVSGRLLQLMGNLETLKLVNEQSPGTKLDPLFQMLLEKLKYLKEQKQQKQRELDQLNEKKQNKKEIKVTKAEIDRKQMELNEMEIKLKKLTLSNTQLDWMHMSILGMLESLEVLELKDNAFKGKEWQPKEKGFESLRTLHIENTDLACWIASPEHFPSLQSLYLRECNELESVPSCFLDIKSFDTIYLQSVNKSAIDSVEEIKQKKQHNGLKFSILQKPKSEPEPKWTPEPESISSAESEPKAKSMLEPEKPKPEQLKPEEPKLELSKPSEKLKAKPPDKPKLKPPEPKEPEPSKPQEKSKLPEPKLEQPKTKDPKPESPKPSEKQKSMPPEPLEKLKPKPPEKPKEPKLLEEPKPNPPEKPNVPKQEQPEKPKEPKLELPKQSEKLKAKPPDKPKLESPEPKELEPPKPPEKPKLPEPKLEQPKTKDPKPEPPKPSEKPKSMPSEKPKEPKPEPLEKLKPKPPEKPKEPRQEPPELPKPEPVLQPQPQPKQEPPRPKSEP